MRSGGGWLGAALFTLNALVAPHAAARSTTVLVAAGASESEAHAAERLWAELRSAGYQVYKADPLADAKCAQLTPMAGTLRAYGEAAWTQISLPEGAGKLAIRVCYRDPSGRLSESVLEVAASDVDSGALATVEALNGLRAQPSGCQPCELAPPPPPAPAKPTTSPRVQSLAAGAALVFDPLGLGPIVGATGALKSGLTGHLALSMDVFVPVQAHELRRVDRNIAVDIAWLRLGPTLTWPLWIFNVNASLVTGPALVWADAKTVAPLIGVSRRTAAAIVSAGGSLELPRDAAWFLRGYYEISGIFPRVNVRTGNPDSEHLGPLLFELGASLGLRWGQLIEGAAKPQPTSQKLS